MKRTYQIREWKAIEQFRSHLSNDPGTIQMVLSLAEIAQLLRQGVSHLLHEAEKRLLLIIMDDEVACANTRFTGCDNLMWASDYPHSVTTWPKSWDVIKAQTSHNTPEEREKLLWKNAAKLYRLSA